MNLKMKIVTVVGARPQFIKAAVVSRVLRNEQGVEEVLVHTGQHYDYNMSEVFFKELDIPDPACNLNISGGSHAQMTGRMLMALEEVLLAEKPDKLLVYGDTNSTLAASLAAVKIHIPVFHVEAGNRFGSLDNPEEINRICTDHVSTVLMPCTESALEFLKKEGMGERSYLVGDPMYDAFLYYGSRLTEENRSALIGLDGQQVKRPEKFYYLTCHRQENTDTDAKLEEILKAMNELDYPTIYPVHPRNRERALRVCGSNTFGNIILTQPVGYLTSISLVNDAEKIVTDSGGLQREAFFAEKQCVTVFDLVVWPETMVDNRNQLSKPDHNDILKKMSAKQIIDSNYRPFGDGQSALKIKELLMR